jgi:DNA-binding transcriptional ArsR family regulator
MPQADFAYAHNDDGAGFPVGVSIFADRPRVRAELREDVEGAGLVVLDCGPLGELLDGPLRPLGDIVLVDCPAIAGVRLAALIRLDERAARGGSQLVVSTSLAALDDVFGCCDQSQAQILIDPERGDRVVALGQVLARKPGLRVRDLTEDDRMQLLRLTEQVGRIAERLDRLPKGIAGDEPVFRFEGPVSGYSDAGADGPAGLTRASRPALPDPRLVRRILRHRQLRARFFDGDLFADPAWDMLLDLTVARAEHKRVSVTSLCIASGVPPTTALRWIGQLTRQGLVERVDDEADRRRAFVALSDTAAEAMARYFAQVGHSASVLI